jgi:hypothetical protein
MEPIVLANIEDCEKENNYSEEGIRTRDDAIEYLEKGLPQARPRNIEREGYHRYWIKIYFPILVISQRIGQKRHFTLLGWLDLF